MQLGLTLHRRSRAGTENYFSTFQATIFQTFPKMWRISVPPHFRQIFFSCRPLKSGHILDTSSSLFATSISFEKSRAYYRCILLDNLGSGLCPHPQMALALIASIPTLSRVGCIHLTWLRLPLLSIEELFSYHSFFYGSSILLVHF